MLDGLITRRSKVQILSPLLMVTKKQGLPAVDEFVLCTVTNIQFHSVFAKLDEYDCTGMIHISEISPGRVKNVRDYVQEGKKLVCKILRVDKERGHIDLSLRRVSESERRAKMDSLRHDAVVKGILKQASAQTSSNPEELLNKIQSHATRTGYDSVFTFFEDVSRGEASIEESKISEKEAEAINSLIKTRFKPPRVEVGGMIKVSSYAPDGVEIIKNGLKTLKSESTSVKYLGGGRYSVKISSSNYKTAEKKLKEKIDPTLEFYKKKKATATFERS